MPASSRTVFRGNVMRRIALWSAVAAATLGATALPMQASIIYSGTQNLVVPNDENGVYLNVETDASAGFPFDDNDLNFWADLSSNLRLNQSTTNNFKFDQPSGYVGAGLLVTNLASGATIDASSTFGQAVNATMATFSGLGFVGFRFIAADNQLHYGWIRVDANTGGTFPATLIDWAYDGTPNAGIQAGAGLPAAVPEPSSFALMLLAGGAVGVHGWRRRKRTA